MRGTLRRIRQTILVEVDCTNYATIWLQYTNYCRYYSINIYTYVYVYMHIYISNYACIRTKNNAPRKLRNWISIIKNKMVFFFLERLFAGARTTNHQPVPRGQLPRQCPSHGRWRELVQKSPRDQRKLPKSSTSKAIWMFPKIVVPPNDPF